MNIEEIKNDFSVDYIKHINNNNTKYDISDFSSLLVTLYGGSPFNLNGEQLEFTNDNNLNESDVTEILIDIYENLSPDLKDGFLNEALNNSRTIPYKATEYFEKIKQLKENETSVNFENENEETEEETLENDVEENNINNNSSDLEPIESETEILDKKGEKETEPEILENKVEKEPETEISFDNGPAIRAYEEETLALEREIEELEIQEVELDEDSKNKLNKMEEELKEQEQILKTYKRRKQNLIDRNNLTNDPNKTYSLEIIKNAEYKINEQTKIVNDLKNQLMLAKKELIEKNNNIRIDERIKNLEEKYKEIELEAKKYYDNNKGIPLELHGRKKAIEDAINRLKNSASKDLTSKKQELEEHKKNIKTYYECLEDIKNLNKDVQDGLDINSEEFANRVHAIDQKKVTLPEPLKNELTEFLMNIKKTIPIDKIEKNPKLTWKTFAFIAGGFGLGALIGFTVPPLAAGAIGVGLQLTKGYVEDRAKEKRLNGENEIASVELPDNKLKAGIEKFKNYIKSEEGLRDISYGLTSGMLGIAAGLLAKVFVGPNNAPTETITQNTQVNSSNLNNPQPVDTNPYNDIRIGDNVGSHNVSVGHDSANWAVNNTNAENLIGKYVNSDSVFQRFAEMNPDGSIKQIINTNGMSISDLQKMGVDPSRIAVDVGKNGVSQAWVNITELTKDVANVGRSIH